MTSRRAALVLVSVVLASVTARGQEAPAGAPPETFGELALRAGEAREGGRLPEAARLYEEAVTRRAEWDEGWWHLGAALYQSDRCDEARAAFARFVALKPEVGPGWALRGLCEFEVSERVEARTHLEKALALGLGGNRELERNVRWTLAALYVKEGEFERAMEPLTWLAALSTEMPGLDGAIGLALLRRSMLPSEVPESERDLVGKVGRAGRLLLATREDEAKQEFDEVVEAYPEVPWIHYAYGAALKKIDPDRALAEFRRELEIQPTNVYALLEIAFELLLRGAAQDALGPAERAALLAPDLFAARYALGRVLVDLDQVERGIVELERAAILAPDVPEMHFALARAYARAGRTEDTERARARFAELVRRAEGGSPPATAPEDAKP